MSNVDLRHGDCLAVMRELPDNSVDAICTDPPYGLAEHKRKDVEKALLAWLTGDREHVPTGRGGFMGKEWDRFVPPPAVWDECFRVLKPGGHLLAFAGSRTFDLMAISIRLAGLDTDVSPEIRDSIAWLYGSGFSKGGLLGNKPGITWCACGTNPVPLSHAGNPDLRSVRNDVHPTPVARGEGEDPGLLSAVQREVAGRGVGEARAQGPGGVEAGERSGIAGTHDGRVEPGVGGWFLHRAGEGLSDDPSAGSSEGEGERLRGRAPAGDGGDDRATGPAARGGAPHQPREVGQPTGEPEALPGSSEPLDDGARGGRLGCCPRCGGVDPAFQGFSVTLKPAFEPVVVARKPLAKGLGVAQNVQQFGTGALNIDATRIGTDPITVNGYRSGKAGLHDQRAGSMFGAEADREPTTHAGRWPANVALSSDQAAALDQMSGTLTSGTRKAGTYAGLGYMGSESADFPAVKGNSGGASRFFFVAEDQETDACGSDGSTSTSGAGSGTGEPDGLSIGAPRADSKTSTADAPDLPIDELAERFMYCAKAPKSERPVVNGVAHATVKPLTLIRWMARLVTPPGGTILEPFAGSGTTVEAAILEGFDVIAIEREADYLPLIQARIFRAQAKVAAAEESVEPPKKAKGRWPANVALDEESAEALDVQSGISKSSPVGFNNNPITVTELSARPFKDGDQRGKGYTDTGGASRFFFVAKSDNPAPPEPEVWRDGAQQPGLFEDDDEGAA